MKTFRRLTLLTGILFAVLTTRGATTIISDNYTATTSGTGFGLNAGVNTGINPPTTRLTGSTAANLRYLQTVTSRPASAYDINSNRARITTGNNIGRFTLSSDGSNPFDFGPSLGTGYATAANPIVYDVSIKMRNDATGNPRFSLGLATVEGDIYNMDFAIQMYRASSGNNFYTIQKRIDRGSFNGTTTTDSTGDVNEVMTTTGAGTNNTLVDFLIRVTDAGSESGGNYNSRIQVSLNDGSSWIYDTDTDSDVSSRFRFDGTGRYFAFDQAPNTTGAVYYDAFSVTWNSGPRAWTGAGANGNWNNVTNWGGALPVNGSALDFSGTTRQTSTNDLSSLSVPWLTFNNGGFALYGNALTVTSALTNTAGNSSLNGALTLGGAVKLQSVAGTLTVAGGVTGGANNLTVDGAGNTTVSSAVSGSGSLTKNGAGTLQLSGSSANTLSGNTALNVGTLSLAKTAGVNAIAGHVTVGDGTGGAGADVLQLNASNQIADSSTVTVSASGSLNLNGFDETVASVSGASSASQIALGAGTLTVGNGSAITFAGTISGSGNIVKQGSSTLTLSGANTFSGTATISAGVLNVQNATALGSTGATVVNPGTALEIQGGISISGEPLTLNGTGISSAGALRNISGNNNWSGAVTLGSATTLQSDSGTLTISGAVGGGQNLTVSGSGNTTVSSVISGAGSLTKDGSGTTTLSGASANTYSGGTTVNAGTLSLAKTAGVAIAGNLTIGDGSGTDIVQISAANQIADSAAITISAGGTLDLNGNAETVASVSSASSTSQIALGAGTLTLGDVNPAAFAGAISGSGSLVKNNLGTVVLTGNNTYSGNTTVNAGTLEIGAGGSIANSSTITIGDGAILDVVAVDFAIGSGKALAHNSTDGVGFISGAVTFDSGGQVSLQADGTGKTIGYLSIEGDVTFNGNTININVANTPLGVGSYPVLSYTGFKSGSFNLIPNITGAGIVAGHSFELRENADDAIELHVYPQPRIWTGSGADNNWNTTANWTNNFVPTGEDPVVFNGTTRQNNTNNLSGLTIESLTFNNGGFTVNGNALINTIGVMNLAGINTIKGDMAWSSESSKIWEIASGSELVLDNTNTVEVIGNHELVGGGTLRLKRKMIMGATEANPAFVVSEGTHIMDGSSFTSSGGYYIGTDLTSTTARTILTNGASLLLTSGAMLSVGDIDTAVTSHLDIYNSTIDLSDGILALPFSGGATGMVTQIGGSVSNVFLSFSDSGEGEGSYSISNGTLSAVQIIEFTPGNSSMYFDNAILRTAPNTDPAFMSGLDIADIQSGGLTIDASVDVNIDQEFSGSGALTKTGANKVTLNGVNTYAGNTTISAGTLAIGATGSIANSPIINLANGATLDISAGGFEISSAQTFVRNTTSGVGNINGTLTLNSDAPVILSATGSGNTVGSIAVTGGLTINGNIITINVSGAALGASTNTIISYTGTKSGSFNLSPIIIGSGLASGMTADIQETAGAIKLRVYAGPRIWRGGGTNDNWSTGPNWLGAVPSTGDTVTFAGVTRQNNSNNLSGLTISSLIFNNGDFTMNGNTLTVTNSITNLVGINTFKNELAWGSTAIKTWHIASGSELRLDGLHTVEVSGDQTFYGGGTMRLTGTWNAGQTTSANGAFVINEGTFIADGGTLNTLGGYRIGANASTQTAQTTLILTNGALINITGTGSNIRVGNSLSNGTGRLNMYNSTVVLNGTGIAIPYTAGATGIVMQIGGLVSNCIIQFSDTGAGTGSYTVKDGTLAPLQIKEDTAAGSSSIYFDNATLRAYSGAVGSTYFTGLNLARIETGGLTIQASVGITVGQVLSGPGALTKIGGSKLTFTGANTYSGNTTISTGTLALGSGGSIASTPAITIANGATFDISVSGFTLGSGKTLACSSTSGSGSITGNIVFSSGALGSFQANGTSSTVGSLAVAGNLTANGNTLNVNITSAPLNAGTYTLLSYTGTKTGSFNATPIITGLGLNPGLSADIQEAAGQINLRVQQLARVWDGGGANDNWSASANWDNVVPVNGDRVVFAGSTRQSNTNDLSSLSLASMTFSNGGFTLNGNALTLTGALTNLMGTTTIKHDVAWSSTAAKLWNIASGNEISLDNTNTVEVGGDHNLFGGGTLRLKKRMNIGQATTNNPAFVIHEGNQIIDGGTLATRGDYRIGSLGTGAAAKTILTNGATLSVTSSGATLRVGDSTNSETSILEINNSSVILSNANLSLPYLAGASGQVSQNGGTVSGGIINFNQNGAGRGIYSLQNGTLETLQIKKTTGGGQSEIHFDNATLRSLTGASNAFCSGLDVAEIQTGGLSFDATTDATIAQALSGAGSLTKVGANKLTLSGANTYSGNTLVSAGTLAIGTGGSIATSPNIILPTGATLDVSAGSFALGGSQIISCSSTSGTATVNGALTLNSGAQVSLQINGSNGAVGVLNIVGNLTANDNTIVINVNNTALGIGTNTLITYTGTKTGSFYFSPVITGLGIGAGLRAEILETAGAIKLSVFSDTRTWTGGGANDNWSTAANWTGSAPMTGDDLIFNGTTRQNNINDMSGLNILSLTLNNGGFTLNGNTFNNNSAITNLGGVNTIKAGITWAGVAAKWWNIASGSELVLSNTTTVGVAGDHSLIGGGTLRTKGTMNFTANPLFIICEGKHVIDAGVFSSIGGYRIGSQTTGTGAQTILTNGASLTITAAGGGLRVGDSANANASRLDIYNSALTLSGGALLAVPYAAGAIGTVNQTGGTVSPGIVSFSEAGAGTGSYSITNGTLLTRQIREVNAAGTASIYFNNAIVRTDTGANSAFMTGLNTAQIQSGGLTIDATTTDVTIGQVLSGTGALTKTGANKVTLTAANSYTGATTVSAGNLTVGAGGSIASSTDYGIASGATLDVSGITFTVANPETLSCNSSSGTANVAGNVTLNSGSFFSSLANGGSDTVGKIAVTGNITVNNNTIVVNVTGGTLGAGTYPVLTYTGTKTGSFNAVPNITGSGLAAGLTAQISQTAGTISLKVTSPAETNTVFRVMSYNIHWALGPDGNVNTDRIANYVLNHDIDLVGFNEVARFWAGRAGGRDIIGEIADKTGYNFCFTNNKTDLNGNDSFGNAILSRYPILYKEHRFLPKVGDNEQRGWLKAVVEVGNGKFISFQTTHLDFHANHTERLKCGTNLNAWVAEETFPTLLVGDFNDTPNTPIYNLMDQEWLDIWTSAGDGTLGRTVPCPGPPGARIDYIWKARGWNLTPTNAFVALSLEASDHFGVVSDIILKDGTNHELGFSFPFNAGTGTNVVDTIGNLKGILGSGAPTWNTNSPTGQASDYSLWFNGNKKLIVPDPKQILGTNGLNDDYTLQCWVKVAVNYATTDRAILFQYERKPGFALSLNTNRTLHTTTFKVQDISTSAALPNDGLWHHIAVVHTDGQNMKFYIDGSLSQTVSYTGGAGYRTDSRIVMGADFNDNNQFTGFLDRVKFDNHILTPEQFDYPAAAGDLLVNPVNDYEAWKALYGITDSEADDDGDGQNNLAEYIAHTNPTDVQSSLRVLDVKCNATGQATVTWSSVGGIRYRIQYADGLDGQFVDLERDVAVEMDASADGATSSQSFTETVGSTNKMRFYRVKIIQK